MYTRARDSFWVPKEINLSTDVRQWAALLTPAEKRCISRVLSFFATADGIVAENLVERFASEVTVPEARFFYGFQIAMWVFYRVIACTTLTIVCSENIHAETYALILTTLIERDLERFSLLRASREEPSIASKGQWALKWISNRTGTFAERLIAFACVEGIYFSSSFAIIYRLKSQGKMPGLCQSNDLIARDEGLHTEFACLLLKMLIERPSTAVVHQIVGEAVRIEIGFAEGSSCSTLAVVHADSPCRHALCPGPGPEFYRYGGVYTVCGRSAPPIHGLRRIVPREESGGCLYC